MKELHTYGCVEGSIVIVLSKVQPLHPSTFLSSHIVSQVTLQPCIHYLCMAVYLLMIVGVGCELSSN